MPNNDRASCKSILPIALPYREYLTSTESVESNASAKAKEHPVKMPLVQVDTPLIFDSEADLLGSGTVGEVFRATLGQRRVSNPEARVFALKRFFNREGRDDFDNERNILEALAVPFPHHAIVYHLSSWVAGAASYLLFPLAAGDLYQFLRTEPPPREITAVIAALLLDRIHGIIDAIRFVHDSGVLELAQHPSPMRRIGFHYDLKPANILLFHDDAGHVHWKLGDFGSGTARFRSGGLDRGAVQP